VSSKSADSQWHSIESLVTGVTNSGQIRTEISLEPAPAPARLATHALTLLADIDSNGDEIGSGRLVILYEPEWQEAWDGNLRLVAFARADLETELVTDPMLLEVGWSWVQDSFSERNLAPVSLSGTVSRAGSQSFGDLSARAPEGSVEIRYSFTVASVDQLEECLYAWCDLLASAAGLAPLPAGVTAIRLKDSK
jgi:hypothetical protein